MEEKDKLDLITRRVIGDAIEVHKTLGPGLLESAYEACVAFELRQLEYKVEQQKPLPVVYKDVKLDCGYRLDLVVEDVVIVEIRAVEQLSPIHDAPPILSPVVWKEGRSVNQFPCPSSEKRTQTHSGTSRNL